MNTSDGNHKMLLKTMDQADVRGKRVVLRLDLNLPMKDGKILDQTRLVRSLPTVNELLSKGASIVVVTHLGRPKGQIIPELSLLPIQKSLEDILKIPVAFPHPQFDQRISLLENIRFHKEEEENDPLFSQQLASYGDLYINDAFSVSHRAHSSVEGITHHLPSYGGRLMETELQMLHAITQTPQRPMMAIIAGSKVSTKLDLLKNFMTKVDVLVLGGGIANTFLKAQGYEIGLSLHEDSMIETARTIMQEAKHHNCTILLPSDCKVAYQAASNVESRTVDVSHVPPQNQILDIGTETLSTIAQSLKTIKTVLWNGPMGVFEVSPFNHGTEEIARLIAECTDQHGLISVAGGGETVAAITASGCASSFTYLSTAGGAFLEYLEGKILPGITPLIKKQ